TQIRHVKKLASMNFVVGDKEVLATIEKMEGGKMVTNRYTSNTFTIFLKNYGTRALTLKTESRL
ncbi:MAG TPA: hypothetical protein VEL70_07195, partial [Candidatus Acidoferrum sp.]|nr:hypothetical protein [Candidatus Acidoferrum sp.]